MTTTSAGRTGWGRAQAPQRPLGWLRTALEKPPWQHCGAVGAVVGALRAIIGSSNQFPRKLQGNGAPGGDPGARMLRCVTWSVGRHRPVQVLVGQDEDGSGLAL